MSHNPVDEAIRIMFTQWLASKTDKLERLLTALADELAPIVCSEYKVHVVRLLQGMDSGEKARRYATAINDAINSLQFWIEEPTLIEPDSLRALQARLFDALGGLPSE